MGFYVNPHGCSKEEWLQKNAIQVTKNQLREAFQTTDKLPVVLVENLHFTAAGICYDIRELESFIDDPEDDRSKEFYIAEIEKLKKVSDTGFLQWCKNNNK